MKVQDLYRKYTFGEIVPHLEYLFRVNAGSSNPVDRWSVFYDYWTAKAAPDEKTSPQNHVRLVSRWEGCSPMLDMNCAVYDENEMLIAPLAAYPADDEILAMEVIVEEEVQIAEQELLADLFWEMTYYETEKKLEIVKSAIFSE